MTKRKEAVDKLRQSIEKEIKGKGYYLNPDKAFVDELLEGLVTNQERYGYLFCPCRLATGNKDKDLDLICPCDYRDDDLAEYGACYCALYVDKDIAEGKKEAKAVPERRNLAQKEAQPSPKTVPSSGLAYPVHRCKVCGYLVAKNQPPNTCPICGVGKERFELFMEGGA